MGDTRDLALGYTTANATQFSAGNFLLSCLALQPGMAVLDIGCGPGNLTLHLASLVGPSGRIVGIDPSPERLAIARSLLSPNSNVQFFEGKAEDLSRFEPGSFDAVYVNSTLHWVQDQPRAIREFARVLRPGGRLGVSGGSGDFQAAHERIKAAVLSRPPYAAYEEKEPPKFLKRREMEELLDAAGFGERDIVVNTIVKTASGPDDMIDWLDTSSSGKTYGGIPVELRPQAREEMRELWRELVTEEGIRMDMELLVTVAVKV